MKEKILAGWNILAIEESEVLPGFREVVGDAYVKALRFDEYLRIIQIDKALASWGVDYAPIDWDKIIHKINEMISEIERTGAFDSDRIKISLFMPEEQVEKLTDKAKQAYYIIENYNGDVRKNRFELIDALNSYDFEKLSMIVHHKYFEEFDNEMIECFIDCYKNTDLTPRDRRKLILSIEDVINSCLSHSIDKGNLLNSLCRIKAELEGISYDEGAIFSRKLHEEFIAHIVEFIDELRVEHP